MTAAVSILILCITLLAGSAIRLVFRRNSPSMPHDANGHLLSPGDEVTTRPEVRPTGRGPCRSGDANPVRSTPRPWPEEQASYIASRPY